MQKSAPGEIKEKFIQIFDNSRYFSQEKFHYSYNLISEMKSFFRRLKNGQTYHEGGEGRYDHVTSLGCTIMMILIDMFCIEPRCAGDCRFQ